MKIAEYRRQLDDVIRPDQFKTNYYILAHVVGHITLIAGTGVWIGHHIKTVPVWGLLLWALVTGHSVACLGFAAHEIEHQAAVKRKEWVYLWETLSWVFSLTICTTIHRKAHYLHHAYLNSVKDPNSRPLIEEAQMPGFEVGEWLFPNSKHPIASAFLGLWLVNLHYQMALLFHTVFQSGSPRFDMRMPRRRAMLAMVETFVFNVGAYAALWATAGFHWKMLVYLGFMNYVGTAIALAYICTNHMLNPALGAHVDPLELSLTIKVPAWADFFHFGFSKHNEHHLYPKAGPRNYALIEKTLKERFPERYHEMTFWQAYRAILKTPLAITGRNTLADAKGEMTAVVPFPSFDAAAVETVPST